MFDMLKSHPSFFIIMQEYFRIENHVKFFRINRVTYLFIDYLFKMSKTLNNTEIL